MPKTSGMAYTALLVPSRGSLRARINSDFRYPHDATFAANFECGCCWVMSEKSGYACRPKMEPC